MKTSLPPTSRKSHLTLDLKPSYGEMIKPAETIDIVGIEGLTLQDQRIWNALLDNAHGPAMRDSEKEFTIDLSPLRSSHNSNERVEDSIERLMKTIAVCRMPDGSTTRFQLLGGNNMGDPNRPRGEMTYRFDKALIDILSGSISFGKLELPVMAAFSSKYALALYEHVSRRKNLKHVWMAEYSVAEFRDVLRVGKSQLKQFGNFKQRAIIPALEEVNQWASFNVSVSYKKTGQRISTIVLQWTPKSGEKRKAIFEELQKSKVGRKARKAEIVESIVALTPIDSDTVN